MQFASNPNSAQTRTAYSSNQGQYNHRYSPHLGYNDVSPSAVGGQGGAVDGDGAMEIRGLDGTTSVYSVDSQYSQHQQLNPHTRSASAASTATYPLPHSSRPHSGASFGQGSQFDDPYGGLAPEHQSPQPPVTQTFEQPTQLLNQYNQQYHQQYSNHDSAYHPNQGHQPQSQPQLQHPSAWQGYAPQPGQVGYGPLAPQPAYSVQPTFQPQPGHGGWGYEQAQQVQQQNPYYAAATQATGGPHPVHGGGGWDHRSSAGSQLSVPHPNLSRSQTSMSGMSVMSSLSGASGPPPGMHRKGTTASGVSVRSNGGRDQAGGRGPPITKQSVDEYRQRIRADPDPEAQFNFAKYLIEAAKKIHASSSGDEKAAKKYRDALLAESLKMIKKLATQGSSPGKAAYPDAQFFLANCLGNGSLGLQVDHEKAYNLYVQASKQNHSSATYRTAVCNEVGAGTRRDHARAVLFYRKASALGDTAGMYKLGMILLNGLLGQQRNPKEAFSWLKRAAAQADEDNPHALHELGLMYEQAQGSPTAQVAAQVVHPDPVQARELFTQAGQYGYPPSQYKLGAAYEYGALTCPIDPRRSIAWYTRAAERGDAESELALSGWYLTGSDGVLKQSDSEAYLWARRAANKGLPKAEYAVGYYSEVGIGVKQDQEEAKRWYMRAAAQGNKRAMQRLTELKKLGEKGKAPAKGKGGAQRPTREQAETECVVM